MSITADAGAPIRVGISACVLGQKVPFDGVHKGDRFLTGTLAQFVEFVPDLQPDPKELMLRNHV